MTPKQKKAHLANLMIMIKGSGFTEDSYGNWTRKHKGYSYRIKVKKINIRVEKKSVNSKIWFKIFSEPIVNVSFTKMASFIKRFSTN